MWHRQPFVHIILLQYEDLKAFHADKSRVQAWVQLRERAGAEYLVVLCPAPTASPTTLQSPNSLKRRISSAVGRVTGLPLAVDSSLDHPLHARILERLRHECVPEHARQKVLRLDVQAVDRGRGEGTGGRLAALARQQWEALRTSLHAACFAGLTKRVLAYHTAISEYQACQYAVSGSGKGKDSTGGLFSSWFSSQAQDSQTQQQPWSYTTLFSLKEGLCFTLYSMRLYSLCLTLYDELEASFMLQAVLPGDVPQGMAAVGRLSGSYGASTSYLTSLRSVPGMPVSAPVLGTGCPPALPTELMVKSDQGGLSAVDAEQTDEEIVRESMRRAWHETVRAASVDRWTFPAHTSSQPPSLPSHVLDTTDPCHMLKRPMIALGTIGLFDFKHYLFVRQAHLLVQLRRAAELTVRSHEYLSSASDVLAYLVSKGSLREDQAYAWQLCATCDLVESITKSNPVSLSFELDFTGDNEDGQQHKSHGSQLSRQRSGSNLGHRGRAASSLRDIHAALAALEDEPSSRARTSTLSLPVDAPVSRSHSPGVGLGGDKDDSEFDTAVTTEQYEAAGGALTDVARVTSEDMSRMGEGENGIPGGGGVTTDSPGQSAGMGSRSRSNSMNIALDAGPAVQKAIDPLQVAHISDRAGTSSQGAEGAPDYTQTRLAACLGDMLLSASGCAGVLVKHTCCPIFLPPVHHVGLVSPSHAPVAGTDRTHEVTPQQAHSATSLALYRAKRKTECTGTSQRDAHISADRVRMGLWFAAAHYLAAAGRVRAAVVLDTYRACLLVAHRKISAALPLLMDLLQYTSTSHMPSIHALCLSVSVHACACLGDDRTLSLMWDALQPGVATQCVQVWRVVLAAKKQSESAVPRLLSLSYGPSLLPFAGRWHAEPKQGREMEEVHAFQAASMAAVYVESLQKSTVGSLGSKRIPCRPLISTAVSLQGSPCQPSAELWHGGEHPLYEGGPLYVTVYVASAVPVPVLCTYVEVSIIVAPVPADQPDRDSKRVQAQQRPPVSLLPLHLRQQAWVQLGPSRGLASGGSLYCAPAPYVLPQMSASPSVDVNSSILSSTALGAAAGHGTGQPRTLPVSCFYTGAGNAVSDWEVHSLPQAQTEQRVTYSSRTSSCSVRPVCSLITSSSSKEGQGGTGGKVHAAGDKVEVKTGITAITFSVPPLQRGQSVSVSSVQLGCGAPLKGTSTVPLVLQDSSPLQLRQYAYEYIAAVGQACENAAVHADPLPAVVNPTPAVKRDAYGRVLDREVVWCLDSNAPRPYTLPPTVAAALPTAAAADLKEEERHEDEDASTDIAAQQSCTGVSVVDSQESFAMEGGPASASTCGGDTPVPTFAEEGEGRPLEFGIGMHSSGIGPGVRHAVHGSRGPRPFPHTGHGGRAETYTGLQCTTRPLPSWIRMIQGTKCTDTTAIGQVGPSLAAAAHAPPYFPPARMAATTTTRKEDPGAHLPWVWLATNGIASIGTSGVGSSMLERDHRSRRSLSYPTVCAAIPLPYPVSSPAMHAYAQELDGQVFGHDKCVILPAPDPVAVWMAVDADGQTLAGCRRDATFLLALTPGCSPSGLAHGCITLYCDLPAGATLACLPPDWTWPQQPGHWPMVRYTGEEVGITCMAVRGEGRVRPVTVDVTLVPAQAVQTPGCTSLETGGMRVSIQPHTALVHDEALSVSLAILPHPSSSRPHVHFLPVCDPAVRIQGLREDGTYRMVSGQAGSLLHAPLDSVLQLGLSLSITAQPTPASQHTSSTPCLPWRLCDPTVPLPVHTPVAAHVSTVSKVVARSAMAACSHSRMRMAGGTLPISTMQQEVEQVVALVHGVRRKGRKAVLVRVPRQGEVQWARLVTGDSGESKGSTPASPPPPPTPFDEEETTAADSYNPFDEENAGTGAGEAGVLDQSVLHDSSSAEDEDGGDAWSRIEDGGGQASDIQSDASGDDRGSVDSDFSNHETGVGARALTALLSASTPALTAVQGEGSEGSALLLLTLPVYVQGPFVVMEVSLHPPRASGWTLSSSTLPALHGCRVGPCAPYTAHVLAALLRCKRTITAAVSVRARVRVCLAVPGSTHPLDEYSRHGRSRSSSLSSSMGSVSEGGGHRGAMHSTVYLDTVTYEQELQLKVLA